MGEMGLELGFRIDMGIGGDGFGIDIKRVMNWVRYFTLHYITLHRL